MIVSPDTKRRLTEAILAIEQDKPNKAAGLFREVADAINAQAAQAIETGNATADQLGGNYAIGVNSGVAIKPDPYVQARNLESCGRNVHVFGPPDPVTGWRTCTACGQVNVAPPRDA